MTSRPSYTRLGFNSWFNYTFLAAAAAITVWKFPQLGYTPLMVAGAIEALWLSVGVRMGSVRRYLNFVHQETSQRAEAGERKIELRGLGDSDRERYLLLERMCGQIDEQVETSSSLSMDMISEERGKIDQLLATYLRLAKTASRYEHFVETSDLNQIEEELRRQDSIVEKADQATKGLAVQNRQIIQRRLDKAIEVRKQIRQARGQLNLIENTFQLLRDQILTMSSPDELSNQLDELTRSVDAIETADKETRSLMNREMASS
jgi:hypothetical protein